MIKVLPKIGLTCGDPAGVGPELIERWLKENPELATNFLPIGPAWWVKGLPVPSQVVGDLSYKQSYGQPSETGAKVAIEAMEWAAQACIDGQLSSVVTGPIHKANSRAAGFAFPGQTEFFQSKWGGEASMVFSGGRLRVVLATWHIPLKDVSSFLTQNPAAIRIAVDRAHQLGRLEEIQSPRIGVCGLNPHAGESGLMGLEEAEWINALLDELRVRYPLLSPCQSADTIFYRMLKGEYDVVVALYHDQALIPVKTMEFDQAVNITLGLPYLRCSPDHGTAFEIAGKGLARVESLDSACRWMLRACNYGGVLKNRG